MLGKFSCFGCLDALGICRNCGSQGFSNSVHTQVLWQPKAMQAAGMRTRRKDGAYAYNVPGYTQITYGEDLACDGDRLGYPSDSFSSIEAARSACADLCNADSDCKAFGVANNYCYMTLTFFPCFAK